MTPQERQLRILEFIERYQRDRRHAPDHPRGPCLTGSESAAIRTSPGTSRASCSAGMVAWVARPSAAASPSARQVRSGRRPRSPLRWPRLLKRPRPPGPAASQRPAPPPILRAARPLHARPRLASPHGTPSSVPVGCPESIPAPARRPAGAVRLPPPLDRHRRRRPSRPPPSHLSIERPAGDAPRAANGPTAPAGN